MKRTFGTICLFLMACLCLQAAQVDTLMVRSESMNKDIKVVAVRPDKAVKGEKCPVVYLLHGYSGHAKTWIEVRPDLPQIADRDGIIFVCPDGGYDSWYWDSPVIPESRYETFISKELIEYTDKNLNAIPDRSKRAITGLSMGGHGAMWNAIRHLDVFGATGSTSGGLDIRPFPNNWGMKKYIQMTDSQPHGSMSSHTQTSDGAFASVGNCIEIFVYIVDEFFGNEGFIAVFRNNRAVPIPTIISTIRANEDDTITIGYFR